MSEGDAGVQAYIASMEPWQAAIAKHVDALVCEISAGVEKLRRLNESFEGILEVLGGEHEKVGFDRGPVGI